MSGSDSQEKTEEPTEKRKEKAREDGQVPQSKELTSFILLCASALGVLSLGGWVGQKIMIMMKEAFSMSREEIFDPSLMIINFTQHFIRVFVPLVPYMILLALGVVVAHASMAGGVHFSQKALGPDFSKMNPIKGIKRIFSIQSLVELFKSILKFLIVASVAVHYLYMNFPKLNQIALMPFEPAFEAAVYIVGWAFAYMAFSTFLIVIIDVPFQLYSHNKKLKMSMQEIKDEFKDSEGKPEIKQKIRQLQMEMAQGRMMSAVPDADVVITNPTHYAVALKYDEEQAGAPIVVAKGPDEVAGMIRDVAEANDVPIVQAPPLARSIYYTTELEDTIPEGLFVAVAQVLAYVYQLREHKRRYGIAEPTLPEEFDIPNELRH